MLSRAILSVSCALLNSVLGGVLDSLMDSVMSGVLDSVLSGVLDGAMGGVLDGVTSGVMSGMLDGVTSGVMSGVLGGVLNSSVLQVKKMPGGSFEYLGRVSHQVEVCTFTTASTNSADPCHRWLTGSLAG